MNSAVKYFYQNGEFMANDDDWMDEYNDFQYDDFALLQEEYKYEGSKGLRSNIINYQHQAASQLFQQHH